MKVVLLKDIAGVGKRFDMKNVADGHAVNFLFPRKLAEPATPQTLKRVESEKVRLDTERKIHEDLLAKNLKSLAEVRLVMKEKGNEQGHLFAGVHREEISQALKKQTKLDVPAEFIVLESPIKSVGEYDIPVSALGKKAQFKLIVEALR